MSRELRILPEAEAELMAAAEWYESRQPGLGVAFVEAVGRALEGLVEVAADESAVAARVPISSPRDASIPVHDHLHKHGARRRGHCHRACQTEAGLLAEPDCSSPVNREAYRPGWTSFHDAATTTGSTRPRRTVPHW